MARKGIRSGGLLMVTQPYVFPSTMVVAHVKGSMIDKWSQPWFVGFTWILKSQTQSLKLLME